MIKKGVIDSENTPEYSEDNEKCACESKNANVTTRLTNKVEKRCCKNKVASTKCGKNKR